MMELNISVFHSFPKRTVDIPPSKQAFEPINIMKSDLWQKCPKWYENTEDNKIILQTGEALQKRVHLSYILKSSQISTIISI